MRIFQILTRRVAAGKAKLTRKLIDRARWAAGGKRPSNPPASPQRDLRRHFLAVCATLVAAIALPVCALAGTTSQPGGYSAAALFNQGNALARVGKTGLAVLNYERALLLEPNDADMVENLSRVRAMAGLPDPREPWFARAAIMLPPNTLAVFGSLGLLLVGMSAILIRLYPRRRLVFCSVMCAGAALVAGGAASAMSTWPRMKEAVVMARDVPARLSPVPVADMAFNLREGETVTVLARRNGFALAQNSAGRRGWIALLNLASVVPRPGERPAMNSPN
jgi:hypothetical protein